MHGIISQQVAGFWWRYQLVPLCPSCANDLPFIETSDEAEIQIVCPSCGMNVFRAVQQHALSQTVLELAAQHEAALAKTPAKQQLRVDTPASKTLFHTNPSLKIAQLHHTIIPNSDAHSN